ncbi:MAG TPA: DNA polymerase IV [Baekduia sp.]|nr:DNA polymerase IV [Baekduia sp.]
MSSKATILHADADAFFAAVEQRDDPQLRGRPVLVGGGVVLAASYEAKACGVRSGMGGATARRLCPDAVVVPPRFGAYVEAGRALVAVFEDTAPIVERLSMEEAFLDVRGLERISGSPPEIAARLRRDVRERVGLVVTVGVARTKVLAKIASGVAKPDGLLVVAPEDERAFLEPLPVERVWGIGPATARRLREHGLVTVGQLAQTPEAALVAILGRSAGRYAHAVATGRDARRVRHRRGRRSMGAQRALGRGVRTPEDLDRVLVSLVERVTRRMRRAGAAGRTVVLRVRFADFTRAARSRTLPHATASTAAILVPARALLAAELPVIRRRGITLLGVTVTNLDDGGARQLVLPLDGADPEALERALDDVRDRFGVRAVTRGALAPRQPDVLPADGGR